MQQQMHDSISPAQQKCTTSIERNTFGFLLSINDAPSDIYKIRIELPAPIEIAHKKTHPDWWVFLMFANITCR